MKNQELSQSMVSSNFVQEDDESLIHYQLETDKILERIELKHNVQIHSKKFRNTHK